MHHQYGSDFHEGSSRASGMLGAKVEIRDLRKVFGKFVAVDSANLSIEAGEFVSLLGPSGSGKSTILMNVAGFQVPTSGQVLLADSDILKLPAFKRNIGMVFQNYALFPHMTAQKNVEYPLRMRGWSKEKRSKAALEALETMRLGQFADRFPKQLSGGQQQRVALARAVVFKPPLLLMDEPLSALDKKLREDLQFEIKHLQEALGITVIFVTHDQSEALAMSDRIAVMNDGCIQQFGSPTELYNDPINLFVAEFVGESNRFGAHVVQNDTNGLSVQIAGSDHTFKPRIQDQSVTSLGAGGKLNIIIRPEKLEVNHWSEAQHGLRGLVLGAQFGGYQSKLEVKAADVTAIVTIPVTPGAASTEFKAGDDVSLSWADNDAMAFGVK